MKTFRELGLSCEFVSVLEKENITTPSEIQEKTIPLVLAGKDVIGGSATGSGKTIAFGSSIIENLEKNGKVQALILIPTRELAEQVATTIAKFSKHRNLNVLSVYGGVSIGNQIKHLKNADVVVGTPGRILDHLNRRTLNLRDVKFLVLDEVDRMFDMGFQVDVEKILRECQKKRQTMLFSATISSEMDYLAKKYTQNPTEVSVQNHVDPSKLKQVYYDVPDGLKFSLFVHLLKKEKAKLVMVFCSTRRNVDFVTKNLTNLGINVKAIHGGLNQNKRSSVLNEFNSDYGVNVLVCTDVAARGLDIQGVSHVYNYDIPKTSIDYIHRIGRTARAGKEGIAINILCSKDYENFSNVSKDEKLKIEEIKIPYLERLNIIVPTEKKSFGRYGNRQGFSRGRSDNRSFNRGRDNKPRENRGFSRGQSNNPRGTRDFNRGRSNAPRPSFNRDRPSNFNRNSSGVNRNKPNFNRGRSNAPRPSFNRNRSSFNRDRPSFNRNGPSSHSTDNRGPRRDFRKGKEGERSHSGGQSNNRRSFSRGRVDTRRRDNRRRPDSRQGRNNNQGYRSEKR